MTPENVQSEFLLTLTSDIVAAHVSNNAVTTGQVPALIQGIYDALANLGRTGEIVAPPLEPAVTIRSSVKPDSITCLDCGKKMKMLKRHLSTEHDISVEDYRARWKLPADYPVVAPNYAEKRRELAKTIGLGRKPGTQLGRQRASKKIVATST